MQEKTFPNFSRSSMCSNFKSGMRRASVYLDEESFLCLGKNKGKLSFKKPLLNQDVCGGGCTSGLDFFGCCYEFVRSKPVALFFCCLENQNRFFSVRVTFIDVAQCLEYHHSWAANIAAINLYVFQSTQLFSKSTPNKKKSTTVPWFRENDLCPKSLLI